MHARSVLVSIALSALTFVGVSQVDPAALLAASQPAPRAPDVAELVALPELAADLAPIVDHDVTPENVFLAPRTEVDPVGCFRPDTRRPTLRLRT